MAKRQTAEGPEAAAEPLIARAPTVLTNVGTKITDEAWQRIVALMDPDQPLTREEIYPFDLVATSDGLDFYFTRMTQRSLDNVTAQLRQGAAILAHHNMDTFPYGASYDAEQVDARGDEAWYESTFYRNLAGNADLITKRVVVGHDYLVRGVTANGQSTDDLIKLMRGGAQRKGSISFTVGMYQCGIDGKDMLAGWFGPWPDTETGCAHFPGIDYGEDGVGWAWMDDVDLLEQSLVYKNATPSAQLVRKAEELARLGILSVAQAAHVEERLAVRLPRYERRVHPSAATGGPAMRIAKRTTEQDPPADDAAQDPPADDATPTGQADPDTGDTGEEDEAGDDVAPEGDGQADRHAGHSHKGKNNGGHGEDYTGEGGDDEDRSPRRQVTASQRGILTRLAEADIRDVAGLESVLSMAELGETLYQRICKAAREARVRSQGTKLSPEQADRYERSLLAERDVDFVMAELDVYDAANPFKAGRQVTPADPADSTRGKDRQIKATAPTAPRVVSDGEDENIFARKPRAASAED